MAGLLYPAYQKFYSAISCLERFRKEKNFFENIACLDTFLSEYRSITLVMQKSLAHTPYIDFYRNLVATGCLDSWLNTQRVKSVHTHPVEFSKIVEITAYYPDGGFKILSKAFTVEDDVPLDELTESLKDVLVQIDPNEVFFSAKCSFPEKDTGEDVLEKAISGIESMKLFMDSMFKEVGEKCALCSQLREQINASPMMYAPIDFLTVSDYVYYPASGEFDRSGRIAIVMSIDGKKVSNRRPLKSLIESPYFAYDGTAFGTFTKMHAMIRMVGPDADIMPAIMVVYEDDTYDLEAFHADVKTTVYRVIDEIAQRILTEKITEVCFTSLYTAVPINENTQLLSKERVNSATHEMLAVMRVDQSLNEEEYVFDGSMMSQLNYVACVMKHGRKKRLDIGIRNMRPIINAFEKKSDFVCSMKKKEDAVNNHE